MGQFQKRLEATDEEILKYMEFALRTQPIWFMVTIAENLNQCLDKRGLLLYKEYFDRQIKRHKAFLKEPLHPPNRILEIQAQM